ncbi:hypothetical protein NVP1055O_61 [Vibrio phage 1.055.O._10N.286.55.E9]|nr:hypothetical protein NVP1055O_61 [Vibrio phage 1.055.O._10N.286.55.E9]
MLAKLIAFFNPKPHVEPTFKPSRAAPGYKLQPADPRWVSTIEQPQPNVSFLVINKHKGWATETRDGEASFEFQADDVCWCYQHEFNPFVPYFLIAGAYERQGGVFSSSVDTETKSGGQDNCDAGGTDNKSHNKLVERHAALKRYTRELVDACNLSVDDPCKHTFDKLHEQARRFDNGNWLINRTSTKTKN